MTDSYLFIKKTITIEITMRRTYYQQVLIIKPVQKNLDQKLFLSYKL